MVLGAFGGRWVDAQAEGPGRSEAALMIAATWAAAAPEQALKWIAQSPGDASARQERQAAALESWAADDPAAALRWTIQQKDAAGQAAVLEAWQARDPQAVAAWQAAQRR